MKINLDFVDDESTQSDYQGLLEDYSETVKAIVDLLKNQGEEEAVNDKKEELKDLVKSLKGIRIPLASVPQISPGIRPFSRIFLPSILIF